MRVRAAGEQLAVTVGHALRLPAGEETPSLQEMACWQCLTTACESCVTNRIVLPLRPEAPGLFVALVLKSRVPNRQGLVHNQNVRLHADGGGEGQSNEHAG